VHQALARGPFVRSDFKENGISKIQYRDRLVSIWEVR
jgi:hypothetical protein